MTIQNWEKQGLVYPFRAQIPTIWRRTIETWRIFFADRTSDNKSFIRYIDVEAGNPKNIIYEHREPVLDFGDLGSFDHDGTMPSCILDRGHSQIFLYYIGFSQRQDVPYQNLIGLAYSNDRGKTFKKYGTGPIISTGPNEPFFASTPYVLPEVKSNFLKLKMWYLSCAQWRSGNPPEPRYNIKVRESEDGINWSQEPRNTINFNNLEEGGICRPSLIETNKMWYCYRKTLDYRTNSSNSYRIGYAEQQPDGCWLRKDNLVNLKIGPSNFDNQMLAYPAIIDQENKYYMLYNGNQFGKTGIGLATLEKFG